MSYVPENSFVLLYVPSALIGMDWYWATDAVQVFSQIRMDQSFWSIIKFCPVYESITFPENCEPGSSQLSIFIHEAKPMHNMAATIIKYNILFILFRINC